MRPGILKVFGIIAGMSLLSFLSHADNPCIEGGPHTNWLSCVLPGTLSPGYVYVSTNISVVAGQAIVQPPAYGFSITNGLKRGFVTFDCSGQNYYVTNLVTYANYPFGNPYYVPSIPGAIFTPGTYTYSGKVISTGGLCSPLTNAFGTLTITVKSNNPDALIDIDFGGGTASAKTGYAVVGDSASDFWNYYARTGQSYGAIANLSSTEKNPSPIGLLVTNLPNAGNNGSSDAMYNDYLATSSGIATLTVTNLSTGTWNVYLYANNGNFNLKVGTTDYGILACIDSSAANSSLWQSGIQYVAFTNVVVTNGLPVTITVNQGSDGVARISGLQFATSSHAPMPFVPVSLGLVSLWQAENNAHDSIGTNDGIIENVVHFSGGQTGKAFLFDNTNADIRVPTSGSLNVGTNKSFTIAGWINPSDVSNYHPIFGWDDGVDPWGVRLSINTPIPNASGKLVAEVYDVWNDYTLVQSLTGTIATNQLQFVALTVNNTSHWATIYCNGNTVGRSSMYPGSALQTTYSLYMGRRLGGPIYDQRILNGLLDGVLLYNRELSSNEIASLYFAGVTGNGADADYDGVSDVQELAQRTNPKDPNSVLKISLGYWPFDDTNTWAGGAGQLPLQALNLVGVPSWNTNAMRINSGSPAVLKYHDVETNGNANINLRYGTVRFWFKPDWSSTNAGGIGPQSEARLVEMGIKGSVGGWWGLVVNSAGTNIYFGTQTNSASTLTTNLVATISWTSNVWHQIVLTYNLTNSSLYIDGQISVTNGVGVAYYPGVAVRTNGFTIGSSSSGTNQAKGQFDELETFNYPLPFTPIAPPATTAGTNFWVTFFRTYSDAAELSLDISGPVAATGTVSIPGLPGGFNQNFTVTPGQVTTVNIPIAAMVTAYDTIETKGIHITANQPVSVYGINFEDAASEAFTGYPDTMLGTTYCVMARESSIAPGANDGPFYSQFAIVATQDGTTVNITPSATANLVGHPGTTTYQISLQQGQTYQINGSDNGSDDVTGTKVSADKPIAVFSGTSLAFVPHTNIRAGNPLVEEQLPISAWGRQALGFPLASRHGGDSYRVLAAYDGTLVTVNGALVTTLQQGQFFDTIISGPVEFQGNNPIQTAQFSNGSQYDDTTGDPFEMLLPPTGHYLSAYTVSTPTGFIDNFLSLFVQQSAISTTLLDGQPVATSAFQPIGISGYYGAQISVSEGAHTISSPKPMGVQVYGFGDFDGYGYVGGIANFPLVADPDQFNVPLNTPTTLDVLANDVFSSRATVVLSVVGNPSHGQVVITPGKNIIYTPSNPTFDGTDQFTYQIAEGGAVDTAVVTINMTPLIAVDDSTLACGSSTVVINVLANDYDVETGNSLSVVSVDGAQYGSVQINPDNTVTYTRSSNAGSDPNSFKDNFIYTITDGLGHFATASVHVTVDLLTASDDSATAFENSTQVIDVLVNDNDVSGGTLTISGFTQGGNGSVAYSADHKTLIYTPEALPLSVVPSPSGQNFSASSVNVHGLACGLITVGNGNTHAALWDTVGGGITDLDPTGTYSVAETINDNGTVVGYMTVSGGANHAFKWTQGQGQLTDLHDQVAGTDFPDSIAYGINNNEQICGQMYSTAVYANEGFFMNNDGSVTRLPTFGGHSMVAYGINDSGLVVGEASTTTSFHAFKWNIGDMVPTDLNSYFTVPNQWAIGVNAQGDIAGYTALYYNQWAYVIQNGVFQDLSAGYINSYAFALNSKGQIVGAWDSAQTGYTDRALYWHDGQHFDLNNLLPAGSGWVLNDPAAINENGLIVGNGTYQGSSRAFVTTVPRPAGPDTFTYTVSDGTCSATATVNVNVVNPVQPQNDSATVYENMATNINVLANDSDQGGGTLTISGFGQGAHGSVVYSADHKSLIYTPTDSNYTGSDTFGYTVSDGTCTASATVNINVINPVQPQDDSATAFENSTQVIDVLVNDNDVSGGTLTISGFTQGGNGSVAYSADHKTLIYTPTDPNFTGSDTFTYTVSDGIWSAGATVNVTVTDYQPLVITDQPTDEQVELNDVAAFNVNVAGGTGSLTYQWMHDGNVVGSDSYLEIDDPQDSDLGSYYVIISDGVSTVTSSTVTLNVNDCIPATAGLIAWWSAEGNSYDNTGLHNGTMSGGSFVAGQIGQAFHFNGISDKIIVPDDPQFALTQSMTIEGWINVNSFNRGYILVRGNNQTGKYPYYLSVESSGTLRFYINSGTSSDQVETPISLGQWEYVAAVLDDSQGKISIYVNGQLMAQKSTAVRPFANFDASTQPAIGIGNHPSAGQNTPFSGQIDELTIYSYALSSDMINGIFSARSGKCTWPEYQLPVVQISTIGSGQIPDTVTLSVPGISQASIFYTLNGVPPTRSNGILYAGPIHLAQPTTIMAFATLNNWQDAPTVIAKYGTAYVTDSLRALGNNQIGAANQKLPLPFVANILVSGAPVPDGQIVTFTAQSPSGLDVTANLSNASDTTGSNGQHGQVQTYLTLNEETGVFTITAHYQSQNIVFRAESVTPVSVLDVNSNYVPIAGGNSIIQNGDYVMVTASGEQQAVTHVLAFYLSDNDTSAQAPIVIFEETAPDSGIYVGSILSSSAPAQMNVPAAQPSFSGDCAFDDGDSITFASADFVKDPKTSSYEDSDEFDFLMYALGAGSFGDFLLDTDSRGSARSGLLPPQPLAMTRSFLRSAGIQVIHTYILGVSTYFSMPSQANVLYMSTHGHSVWWTGMNFVETADGRFGPEDIAHGEWQQGLCMVIIAGCAVLDVTADKWGGHGFTRVLPDPLCGYDWINKGPCRFLGYEGVAPADNSHVPKRVLDDFFDNWAYGCFDPAGNTTFEPIYAWVRANQSHVGDSHGQSAANACAIYACSSPRVVVHLKQHGDSWVMEQLTEDQWAKVPPPGPSYPPVF